MLILKTDSLDYKESGVKQSFVLACAEEVPETYENLFQIIQLKEIKAKFVSDLKLQNILLGLTSNSSKFPCPSGHCFKNCDGTWSKGNDKSFGEISQYSNKWKVETGGDRKRLKDYFNYEFTPLLPVPSEGPSTSSSSCGFRSSYQYSSFPGTSQWRFF